MKIAKITKYRTKLLKFKLLKTKVYQNQINLNYGLLKDSETRLKKILHIIYRFHIANKKILFIGMPFFFNAHLKDFLKGKKHSFLPEGIWVDGVITNSKASFKHLLRRNVIHNDNISKFLFKLKNKIDLIVILNEESNIKAIKESALKRVPMIALNSNYHSTVTDLLTYKAAGNYVFTQKEIRNNLFFLLLKSLFKKAEVFRKTQYQLIKKRDLLKRGKKKYNYLNFKRNVVPK